MNTTGSPGHRYQFRVVCKKVYEVASNPWTFDTTNRTIPNATSGIGLAATAMGATATVEPSSAALVSAAVIIRRIEEALPLRIRVLPNRCDRMLTLAVLKTT